MSEKATGLGMIIGATDVSIPVLLRAVADGTEVTGVTNTDVTASYWRQGGSRTAITVSSLTNIDDAHSDGGWKEVDSTNCPGLYRFDIPDAAFASGADWVIVAIVVTDSFVHYERFNLPSNSGGATAEAGAIEWTYNVTNDFTGEPIPDVDVWVTSDEEGSLTLGAGRTDAYGNVTFYLDAGTVYVWCQKSGWNFTNPDTEEVLAEESA